MTKAVVFDFDDTLVKGSERIKRETFWTIFRDIPGAETAAKKYVENHAGIPRKEMISGIIGTLMKADIIDAHQDQEKLVERYLALFALTVQAAIEKVPEMPGATEILSNLSQSYPVYLFSATPQDTLEDLITRRGWKQFFKGIYGAPPGTKVEHLGEIIDREKVAPEEVVVIGDGPSDLASAQRYGCKFVGIKGEFSDFGADPDFPALEDLRGLPDLISRL